MPLRKVFNGAAVAAAASLWDSQSLRTDYEDSSIALTGVQRHSQWTPPLELELESFRSMEAVASAEMSDAIAVEYDPDTGSKKHPLWLPEWARLGLKRAYACSVVLFIAGILCSAGGIGGGGIYVTVLMIAGQLSVHDAVPLSKAIVFFGSMSSLVLNMQKSIGHSKEAKTLIDYNICRLVVPAALIGTYLGVFLNRILPSVAILACLTTILIGMSISTVRSAFEQYSVETVSADAPAEDLLPEAPHTEEYQDSGDDSLLEGAEGREPKATRASASAGGMLTAVEASKMRNQLTKLDVWGGVIMLVVVILGGVLHFHTGACALSLELSAGAKDSALQACHHPIFYLFGNKMQNWMGAPISGAIMTHASVLVPAGLCITAMVFCTTSSLQEGWRAIDVLYFQGMAVITGALAGLVGIGGGLIFAPFFLLMGAEPAVAVATSSTCVIFTSSSTTMQYLLTDRIIISLTVLYGVVNLIASYMGTKFVHFLQDTYGARKSFITAIVAVGVLISAVLSVMKMYMPMEHH